MNHAPRRIGYWALLDVERFGPALSARVAREEIRRRLPDAVVRTLAPLGHVHPVRADGGDPAEPLGPWGSAGATELAEDLDCLIIAGDLVLDADGLAALYREGSDVARDAAIDLQLDGLGSTLEEECPVLWQAVAVPAWIDTDHVARLHNTVSRLPLVGVRDDLSRRRLEALGVERDIDVVADPLLLVPRILSPDLLEKRLTYLRLMGWYPPTGEPLLVHGGPELLPRAPELADALSEVVRASGVTAVVLAELGPKEGDVADALSQAVGVPAFRLPVEVTAEDVVAAIAAAAGLVGTSHEASTVAMAYRRPSVLLRPGEQGNLRDAYAQATSRSGSSSELAARVQTLDGQFDRIAGIVGGARAGGNVRRMEEELLSLRRAHEMRGATIGAERSYYADRIIGLESEVERLAEETGHLRHWGEAESRGRLHAEQELKALYGTRTFRWTAAVRGAYFGLRSLRRRR